MALDSQQSAAMHIGKVSRRHLFELWPQLLKFVRDTTGDVQLAPPANEAWDVLPQVS